MKSESTMQETTARSDAKPHDHTTSEYLKYITAELPTPKLTTPAEPLNKSTTEKNTSSEILHCSFSSSKKTLY